MVQRLDRDAMAVQKNSLYSMLIDAEHQTPVSNPTAAGKTSKII